MVTPVTCAICLEEIRPETVVPWLECGHQYHDVCLRLWLTHNSTCPMDRQRITIRNEPAGRARDLMFAWFMLHPLLRKNPPSMSLSVRQEDKPDTGLKPI